MDTRKLRSPQSACFVWTPDLVVVIAEHIPQNVVTCTLRLVSKETATLFNDHKTINLSQHVPAHYLAQHFRAPDALRPFSGMQRLRLLCRAAASWSLPQFQMLLAATVRYLTGGDPPASTPTRQLWLVLEEYGGLEPELLLQLGRSAAAAGNSEICRWLVCNGCPVHKMDAVVAAGRGGHLSLMEELRRLAPGELASEGWDEEPDAEDLIAAVARGGSLEDLVQLYNTEAQGPLASYRMEQVLTAAAISPSPDWKAKLCWLESRYVGLDRTLFSKVSTAVVFWCPPDALERLAWLRDRGYPQPPSSVDMVDTAARAGNLPVLRHLLDSLDASMLRDRYTTSAAKLGQLAALQLLHGYGCPIDVELALSRAMARDHLPVASWLVDTFGVGDEQLREAIRCSSLRQLCWLRDRGCFQAEQNLVQAALDEGCSEAVLEWLVEHGCPVQVEFQPRSNVNMGILRCLVRLGWQPTQRDLERIRQAVVSRPLNGPTLQWLQDQAPR